jgi:hypothetical protein
LGLGRQSGGLFLPGPGAFGDRAKNPGDIARGGGHPRLRTLEGRAEGSEGRGRIGEADLQEGERLVVEAALRLFDDGAEPARGFGETPGAFTQDVDGGGFADGGGARDEVSGETSGAGRVGVNRLIRRDGRSEAHRARPQ